MVASCPKKVFRYNQTNHEIEIENLKDCMFCQECVKKSTLFGADKGIKIKMKENEFIFSVESTGVLKPEDIVKKGLETLKRKLNDVSQALKKKFAGTSMR